MSCSGISWAICKSAPRSRQITTPAPHHSVFLQAGCPSCRPTNSVKALNATVETRCTINPQQFEVMELDNHGRPFSKNATTRRLSTSSTVDDDDEFWSFVDNAIDLPWRNFLSPEFGTMFHSEVPLLGRYPKFLYNNTVWDRRRKRHICQHDSTSRFDTIPACGGRTDGHRRQHTQR